MICGGGSLPFLLDEDRDVDKYGFCCYGAATDGPEGCTCWEPVYTLRQAEPDMTREPATRAAMCGDCAFRPDSEERTDGSEHEEPDLLDLSSFFCHQGIRAVEEWRHPDGRVRPGEPVRDYRPPIQDAVPYKADGTPADRCAGHAAHNPPENSARLQ